MKVEPFNPADYDYAPPGESPGNGDGRAPSKRVITPTPYVWREPSKIPLRQWLYGKHYIRKYVSATFAPGGLGKTSLDLVDAIAMAAGRPLLGVPVPKRLGVWCWNGEDPAEETERRIAAILSYFKIPREEIEGWLFTDTGRKTPICIARRGSVRGCDGAEHGLNANAFRLLCRERHGRPRQSVGAAAMASEVGSNGSQLDERVRALVAEKISLLLILHKPNWRSRPLTRRRGRELENLPLKEISWLAARRKVS